MSNPFIRRKGAIQPLGRRALRRRFNPSLRQKQRIVASLKADAARQINKGLEQRLAQELPVVVDDSG